MGIEAFDFYQLSAESDIRPFRCKDDDLNAFLKDDAKKYLSELMAVTYLLEDTVNDNTVAYFSLLNDKIVFESSEKSIWNRLSRRIANSKRRKAYPSVKIGRLAISEKYSGCGLGRDIVRFIKYMFTHQLHR